LDSLARVLRLCAFFCALFALAACAPKDSGSSGGAASAVDDTLTHIHAKGEIVWAGDIQGGEPYVYEDEKNPGKLIGFEVDIADALAKRLGVRARFMQNDWSNLVPALERGDFDVVMNGLEATPDRRARILLSRPYFAYRETLAIRAGDPYKTLADMSGKKIATLNQTYAFGVLEAHKEIETAIYEGVEEPYADLVEGRVDGVLLESIIANRYGCDNPKIVCLTQDDLRGTYILGIRKTDARLKAAIDDALGGMIKDGELQKILEKWELWDEHQVELSDPSFTNDGGAQVDEGGGGARSLDRAQVMLFVQGAGITLLISVTSFALAIPLGMILATVRLYTGPIGRFLAGAYIEIFRGTPVLLQLYVIYFGLAPWVKFTPIVAAILGLGLNYAAYEAEVYRGALQGIPRGQSEAAASLGFTRLQTLWHVLVPQALRNALPAMTNDFVSLLKDSSLVSVITVIELTKRMTIAAVEIRGWLAPGLLCAALYFMMSFPLARVAQRLEKRLARDHNPRLA
jgi:polar amino acid transport system substrate-binding protein